jgi:hypothetical protein
MSYSPTIRELFEHWNHGELLANLEAANKALLERRKDAVVMAPQSEPPKHTASNCLVLQQALLHRAERLQAEAVPMLLENNIYGLALVVRGHYEATAVLGYFCNRLESLKAGNIKFEDFVFNVAYEVLGAKHEQFAKAPNPPNILTCIEKADNSTPGSRKRQACFSIVTTGCRTLRIRTSCPMRLHSPSINRTASSCSDTVKGTSGRAISS